MYGGNTDEKDARIGSLLSGKDGTGIINLIMSERNFDKLGMLWTQGAKIPWEQLYSNTARWVRGVPGYPFARQRFPLAMAAQVAHVPQQESAQKHAPESEMAADLAAHPGESNI